MRNSAAPSIQRTVEKIVRTTWDRPHCTSTELVLLQLQFRALTFAAELLRAPNDLLLDVSLGQDQICGATPLRMISYPSTSQLALRNLQTCGWNFLPFAGGKKKNKISTKSKTLLRS